MAQRWHTNCADKGYINPLDHRAGAAQSARSGGYGSEYGRAAPKRRHAPAGKNSPELTAIQTKTFVTTSGTEVSVRNDETIDSLNAAEGQTTAAEVTSDVVTANGAVVMPKGANAQLVIKSSSSGGSIVALLISWSI